MVKNQAVKYFESNEQIQTPSFSKMVLSRLCFPILIFQSREQSVRLGLVPIDDERVIQALKQAKGKALDIGCGANNFIKSYGNGLGVDVVDWAGCDQVIKDAAALPFDNKQFDTVSYLACLNHIPNRKESVKEAHRVLKKNGQIIVTMITPRMGQFIHWLRFRNDPDHQARSIDHSHELLGMSSAHVKNILRDSGFKNIRRKRFVYGLNSIYVATK